MIPELVFIHGWGFDAPFWDALAALLPQFSQSRIDLGFLSAATEPVEISGSQLRILIGHSLGFTHGLKLRQDWKGWVAINGFPRFVSTTTQAGCVSATVLREMRMRLQADPVKTLQTFYDSVGSMPLERTPNPKRLRKGLDELRDGNIGGILGSLDIPGLALAGRKDPLVPLAVSEELKGLMMHDEGGHLLPQTEPAWCARAIAQFISGNFG